MITDEKLRKLETIAAFILIVSFILSRIGG